MIIFFLVNLSLTFFDFVGHYFNLFFYRFINLLRLYLKLIRFFHFRCCSWISITKLLVCPSLDIWKSSLSFALKILQLKLFFFLKWDNRWSISIIWTWNLFIFTTRHIITLMCQLWFITLIRMHIIQLKWSYLWLLMNNRWSKIDCISLFLYITIK